MQKITEFNPDAVASQAALQAPNDRKEEKLESIDERSVFVRAYFAGKKLLGYDYGCQMAIAGFLESYVFGPSGFWTMAPLRYAAKFDPFLSLDCARVEGGGARKGSNFAIWQP